jgi:hypothetical protein
MTNYGLFIVWPNYFSEAENIIADLDKNFNIVEVYDIEWDKKTIYTNIYRFYGDRLATSSIKEKAKNRYKFRIIIIEDLNPVYEFRLNARGVEKVNSNFFDNKRKLREKYNTKFGIHATNDETETNRDLCLLLGINLNDYKKKEKSLEVINLNRNITGHNNWESFDELFYFLNAVESYVILRNVDDISIEMTSDDDIDFLVNDHRKVAYFLNAKKMSKGTQRVNYQIVVKNKKIRVDLRYIGDNYFDIFWQDNCLKNRTLNKDNIYVLDNKNSYYSLIYHSFIHKKIFPIKYLDKFNLSIDELKNKLYEFMYENNYKMVEPHDVTLYFNKKYGGDIKFTKDRRIRNKKGLFGNIKKIFYKINNLIHFRRGPA